jgi:hypothetical protein
MFKLRTKPTQFTKGKTTGLRPKVFCREEKKKNATTNFIQF